MKRTADQGYDGPTLSITTNREGARVHRLIDDTNYPTRTRKLPIRRDPMVEALFGAATAKTGIIVKRCK